MEVVDLSESSAYEHDQLPSLSEVRGGPELPKGDADGADLPAVEEYKAQVGSTGRPESKLSKLRRKRMILLGVAFVVVVVLSISLGVTLGRSGNSTDNVGDGSPSRAPTGAFKTRKDAALNLIQTLGWTSPNAINADSPQYKAVVWLGDNDGARVEIEDSVDFRQRYALAVFYYAMNKDNHPWYSGALKWLSNDNVCKWYIDVPASGTDAGVRCDGQGRVIGIFLPGAELEGSMPDEIRLLRNLEELYLQDNDIDKNLPESIGTLTSLRELDLRSNSLVGAFPSQLGFMTSLRYLSLADNSFSGRIPVYLAGLSNLEALDIGYNDIEGDISELSVLSNVTNLCIASNAFTGNFTAALLSSWPKIEILDMSDNGIQGPLPDNLFQVDSLEIADLHGNLFSGPLPTQVSNNLRLSFLALYDNKLSGNIDVARTRLTRLFHLDLSENLFTGDIGSFELMTDLRYLFLAFNERFSPGPISESLTGLPELVDLSLQATNRTGAIPTGFGSLKNLVLLDLSANDLEGGIPEDIGQAPSLQFLFLNKNNLTGIIPNMTSLEQLNVLLLDRNKLVGPANNICSPKPQFLRVFMADCAEINCPNTCCTACCEAGNETDTFLCDDVTWNGQLDPVAEYEYRRKTYRFNNASYGLQTAPSPTTSPAPTPDEYRYIDWGGS